MFHVMRNTDFSETQLAKTARDALAKRLPSGWLLSLRDPDMFDSPGKTRADEVWQLDDPEGTSALVLVEVKQRPIEARDISLLADAWRRSLLAQGQLPPHPEANVNVMVVSPFLGPMAKERLAEEGISYADVTGNLRFAITRPAIFIESSGANKNPWRQKMPLQSLKGRAAGRAVRAVLDYQPPFGVRELATATKTSAAAISRVVNLLEQDAIVTREEPRGRILSVDWGRLLRRWAVDYSFPQANQMKPWLEPRGAQALFEKLRNADLKYAITGSFAAMRYAPIAEPRLVALYAEDPEGAAQSLGLRPAETGGNVLLGRPFDPVVFERTASSERMTYARVTQVAIDLLTGPGRAPTEAESLIEWMRRNEEVWRIPFSKHT